MEIKKKESREKELEKKLDKLEKELELANKIILSYQENQKKSDSQNSNLLNGINDAGFVQPFKSEGFTKDNAERIDANGLLAKSEKRYRTFVDNAYDAFYISDIDGRIIDVNMAACNDLGYTKEELLNSTIFDIDEGLTPEILSNLNNGIMEQKVEFFERTHKRKNGETFPVEVRGRSIGTMEEPLFLSIARDITERINAEEALVASERKYRTMIERSNDMIWTLDSKGNLTFFNNKVEKITGLKFSVYGGKSFIPIILEEDVPMLMDIFTKTMGGEVVNYELRLPTPKGLLIFATHTAPIYDDAEQIVGVISFGKDITEQKSIENTLKKSEALYRSIFENSPLGIFHFNVDGVITDCNDNFVNIIGSSREVLIGLDMINKLQDKKVIKEVKKTLKYGSGYYDDYYTSVTANKTTPIVINFNAIYNEKNEIISGIGLIEDITKKKTAEESLRKSRNRYQDLFEKSTDAILIIKDGKFVDCNKAAVKMLRYKDKSEMLLTHPSELSPERQPDGISSNEKAEDMMNLAIKNGNNRFEWEHLRADGEVFSAEVLLTSITNDDGSNIIHTVWRDISKRKKREKLQKALYDISEEASKADSIEKFYISLHQIIKGLMPAKNFYIAIYDEKSGIIKFPYHLDEYDLPPQPKPFGDGLTEYVLKKKKSQIITKELDRELQKNGEVGISGEFTKVWIGIYLDFEGERKGVLVLQDYENENAYGEEDLKVLHFVSEQIVKVLDKEYSDARLKQSFKELSKAKEELEIINQNKDRFFSIISHDLRSPFMALMGISQMISEDMDSMSVGEVKEMTGAIYHSTQNLNKLIENLLNWSRLQMNTFEVSPKVISLKEVSENVVNLLQLSAKEKNIVIQNNIDDTFVFADEDCIKTILRNLVNNAIKFTNRGGKVKLSSKDKVNRVEITVDDNGIGIKESVQEKLFSITEKVSEVGTEKETGTGLGLILCKELVEKNGGEIWVKSKFGKGSKFTFTLPTKVGNNNE